MGTSSGAGRLPRRAQLAPSPEQKAGKGKSPLPPPKPIPHHVLECTGVRLADVRRCGSAEMACATSEAAGSVPTTPRSALKKKLAEGGSCPSTEHRRSVKFGQVDVQHYPTVLGGSCGVPSFGGMPIGLGWDAEDRLMFATIENYESIRGYRCNSKFYSPLTTHARTALLSKLGIEEADWNKEEAMLKFVRRIRQKVGCTCKPAEGEVPDSCCSSGCLCVENGIICHEDACGCLGHGCGNPLGCHKFDPATMQEFWRQHLPRLNAAHAKASAEKAPAQPLNQGDATAQEKQPAARRLDFSDAGPSDAHASSSSPGTSMSRAVSAAFAAVAAESMQIVQQQDHLVQHAQIASRAVRRGPPRACRDAAMRALADAKALEQQRAANRAAALRAARGEDEAEEEESTTSSSASDDEGVRCKRKLFAESDDSDGTADEPPRVPGKKVSGRSSSLSSVAAVPRGVADGRVSKAKGKAAAVGKGAGAKKSATKASNGRR
eukprot:Opistho-1_new@15604